MFLRFFFGETEKGRQGYVVFNGRVEYVEFHKAREHTLECPICIDDIRCCKTSNCCVVSEDEDFLTFVFEKVMFFSR